MHFRSKVCGSIGVFAALVLAVGLVGAQTPPPAQQPTGQPPVTQPPTASVPSAPGVSIPDPRGLHATRVELEQLLAAYDSGELQASSPGEVAWVRTRLQQGDFQAGDQIVLAVETHPNLSGTYVLEPTLELVLEGVGGVPLHGVLRSELNDHLTRHLSRYVVNPRVRAQSSIRLMVVGGVSRPGFYSVPSYALITDVIEAAGGTDREANLERIRIERQGTLLLSGKSLEQAIISGRTLDQLNVRAGDRVVVPQRTNFAQTREIFWFGSAILSTVLSLVWLFR